MDRVEAESIRTLYLQIRNTAAAAIVVTIYMICVSWAFTPWPVIVAWTIVQLVVQGARLILIWQFDQMPRADDALCPWARAYAVHQVAVGLAWGACMVLFAHPAEPVTVALTLCCLYSISAGGVPPMAYYPPAFVALAATMHGLILIRLLMTGQFGYEILGVASTLYGVVMFGFCRVQARAVRDSLGIRFENEALLAALKVEKNEADDARRLAEQADLAKSQFLAAASHDLRQPLYALSLYSASLDALRLDESGRRVVRSIQDSIGAMESLFNGLLDLSKLQAGAVRSNVAPVSVDALFDRLSQYFLPAAIKQNVDLRFRSDGELVVSDPTLLEQVLSNLVSNALRYTRAGGVLVCARHRAGIVRFEVWDTGIGIPDDQRDRIFKDFVQLSNPERDRTRGLGLGLAIAQRAAALLGSRIEVASRPGRGSRFALVQPLAGGMVPLPRDAFEPIVLGRRPDLPILIIDDDAVVRDAVSSLLSHWCVQVEAVASAEVAVALVRRGQRYGGVLCDFRLAGTEDGLDAILALRAIDQELPVALVTGDIGPAIASRARTADVPVLLKPLQPEALARLLGLAR